MPLKQLPDAAGALATLPGHELADTTLHRVWRDDLADGTTRSQPWFFASVPDDPQAGGRFDLPSALGGTCYLAAQPVAALLEALQAMLPIIPERELQLRRRTEIQAPTDAPVAADLMAAAATGFGVASALWSASERATTQAWAAALRRDGWWALWAGAQHDTTTQGRAVPLFDVTDGPHPPSGQQWPSTRPIRLETDLDLIAALADRGWNVRGPATCRMRAIRPEPAGARYRCPVAVGREPGG